MGSNTNMNVYAYIYIYIYICVEHNIYASQVSTTKTKTQISSNHVLLAAQVLQNKTRPVPNHACDKSVSSARKNRNMGLSALSKVELDAISCCAAASALVAIGNATHKNSVH